MAASKIQIVEQIDSVLASRLEQINTTLKQEYTKLAENLTNQFMIDIYDEVKKSPVEGITYVSLDSANADWNFDPQPGIYHLTDNPSFKKNDRVILSKHTISIRPQPCQNWRDGIAIICTDLGNIYYRTCSYTIEHHRHANFKKHDGKCIMNNIRIDDLFIRIIQQSKELISQSDLSASVNFLTSIIELNKKYYLRFLLTSELETKIETLTQRVSTLEVAIIDRDDTIAKLEHKLKTSIPVENKCESCGGYTARKKLCAPCGHSKYCDSCIGALNACLICKEKIITIVNNIQ